MRDWTAEYRMLLQGFPRFLVAAKGYESPNPEDDLFVKMAIAGFSLEQPTEEWGCNHFRLVRSYREGDYSDAQLVDRGEGARAYALFACLALGYVLGAYQAEAIDDAEFSRGEALLAGFLAMNEPEILSLRA